MSRATSRRVQGGRLAERHRACAAHWDVTDKRVGIRTLELALEEPVELGIPRRILAVRDAKRIGLSQQVKMKVPLQYHSQSQGDVQC